MKSIGKHLPEICVDIYGNKYLASKKRFIGNNWIVKLNDTQETKIMEHGCTIIADGVIEIVGTTLYFESTGVDINLTKEQFELIADWRAKLHLDSKNYIHDIYLDDSGNECMSVVCTDNSMLEIELLDKIRIEQKFVELVAMNKVIEYMI